MIEDVLLQESPRDRSPAEPYVSLEFSADDYLLKIQLRL